MINNRIIAFFTLLTLILLAGCDELSMEDLYNSNLDYFEHSIKVENGQLEYALNDTIWIKGEMPATLISVQSGEEVTFQNASFLLSGELLLLYTENDSASFLERNFSVTVNKGEVELINVVANGETRFQIDIKYGKPLENNIIYFGLVPKFEGVFGFKALSNVYYGENRTDYTDMSWNNKKGVINHYFDNEEINDEAYSEIPVEVKQYFEYLYGSSFISDKDFYFFNVIAE